MLKFSIITPSFNQGHFIEETILSVINQSYTNWELIIIDGGSSDNTVETIKKYQKHIKYWVSEPDEGQSDAIIKGLKHCTGDIVNWLNSDDTLELNALKNIADYYNSDPDIDVLHGKTWLMRYNDRPFADGIIGKIERYEYLAFMHVPQPSTFMRKKVFDSCGISKNLHYGMDFELVVKAVLKGYKFKKVEDVFSKLLVHKDSKSNNDLAFLDDWCKVVYNVLLSLNQFHYCEKIEHLQLITVSSQQAYDVNVTISDDEAQMVFLEHLYKQFHIRYRCLDFNKSIEIAHYLNRYHPLFYKARNFSKFETRMKFIPKAIFKWIR
jgi:glycosyltransferase involved in cell wall biosynthesis